MNDFVRDKLTDKKGNISPYAEVLAGCCVSYLLIFIEMKNSELVVKEIT